MPDTLKKTLRKFSLIAVTRVYKLWPVNMKPAKVEYPRSPGFIKLRFLFQVVSVLYDLFCPVEVATDLATSCSLGMMIYSGVLSIWVFFVLAQKESELLSP
jgi:hypothetical protein